MAIICDAHRLLFIQAPRTGCTAIERLLMDRFGGRGVPESDLLDEAGYITVQRKHSTIRQLLAERLITPDYAERYVAVTTVRNPFDSLVSLYVKKRETYQERLGNPDAFVNRVRGYAQDMEYCRTHSFEDWLNKRYAVNRFDRLLGRGRRRLYGRYTDGVQVVMRFEHLQEDFAALMRRLGVTGDVTIPMVNATRQRQRDYRDYYTPDTRSLVEYVFKPELDRYGYGFDGLLETRSTPRVAGATP